MREIRAYKTVRGAKRALDNGGRFFNLFAKAGDDIVDSAELAKAAGVYSTGMRAFLYFEMALIELPPVERAEVVSRLSPDLELRYQANRPKILAPSSVESKGQDLTALSRPEIKAGFVIAVCLLARLVLQSRPADQLHR